MTFRHPPRNEGERIGETTQGRIGGQRAQEGLIADKLLGGVPHLFDGQKKQPVLLKKRASVGPVHRFDVLWLRDEDGRKSTRRTFGEFRGGSVYDHQDRVCPLRKCRIELQFALAPRKP